MPDQPAPMPTPSLAADAADEAARAARARLMLVLALGLGTLTAVALLNIGPEGALSAGVRGVLLVERLFLAGPPAILYVFAGIGLGRLWRPLFRASAEAGALQAALGIATLLWLSHLLGWLGVLNSAVALGTIGVGLALGLEQLIRTLRVEVRIARWRASSVAVSPAIAVLFLAAACTPGWLWSSEFGGYDALSYHLQLPREWLEAGRLETLDHNVYSALPSLVEAAFMHLGAAMLPLRPPGTPPLIGDAGIGLLACQMLHAMLSLLAAWCVGRAAAAWGARLGLDHAACEWASAIAAGVTIATPWTIVVGSLAYNETPMLLLAAGAIIVAIDPGLGAWRKGLIAGVLMGAACGVKPTALIMLAPGIALVLAMHVRGREWHRVAIAGSAAGLLMLAPWLARNTLATGNPVFPFAAAVFQSDSGGTGHWTAEQTRRFARGHTFVGSFADRLRLTVLPEPKADQPADIARYRGMSNPQWGLFFALAAGAIVIGIASPRVVPLRRALVVLGAFMSLSMLAWLTTTHIQSRFLLPLIVPGSIAVGLWIASISSARWRAALGCVTIGIQSIVTVSIFASERDRNPLAALDFSVAERTGAMWQDVFGDMSAQDRTNLLANRPPEAVVNLTLNRAWQLLLIGDATPLFYTRPSTRARTGSTLYSTTWDTSIFVQAIAANPDDPAAWSSALKARGIDACMVNMAEVTRLSRSGFADPALTPEAVEKWLRSHTRPLAMWPELGVYLVEPVANASPVTPALPVMPVMPVMPATPDMPDTPTPAPEAR